MFEKTELTTEIIKELVTENIIYAEFAEPGAMGNRGGVILYVLDNEQLICYETSFFSDKKLYEEVKTKLFKRQNVLGFDDVKASEVFFEYHYGGFGNHVFMNKNIPLTKEKGFFSYRKNNNLYQLFCSVEGVFNSVVNLM